MASRELSGGLQLDDDPVRIDVEAVHAFLSNESYWARGRSREFVERSIQGSSRVVGLYDGDAQVGFARTVCDGVSIGYLADVYVLSAYRGRGLGLEMVREIIDGGPRWNVRWLLHTADGQGLYSKLGFGPDRAPHPLMERTRRANSR
jgi:GNAT superfamily N-acetyltransferase